MNTYEDSEAFSTTLSSNYEVFTYMKNLLNLFFLKLSPETHLSILMTIQNLISKGYYKHARAFMASVFSYKEIFQKLLKDCSSVKILTNITEKMHPEVISSNLTLSSSTACFSSFLEFLLTLIKTRMKQFFTTEDSHINIYALSSLISSFSNILNTPIEKPGYLPYTFKSLKTIAEIFKELLPHQDYIRDFNLIEILRVRLESDLIFLINQTELYVYKENTWKKVNIKKIIQFDALLIKIIDSGFQPIENLNHHHGMAALARKIFDSPFLNCLSELLKTRKNEDIFQILAIEAIILIGDLGQEAPNLIVKLLNSEIIVVLIEQVLKGITCKNIRILPGLMNFIYVICLNPKGVELEKKYDLFSYNLKLILSKDLTEEVTKDVSNTKNNCMIFLAMETNKFIQNLPPYKDLAFKYVAELINFLLKQQDDFIKLVESHFSSVISNEKELYEYENLFKTFNNFSEFFYKFLTIRFIDKCPKGLTLSFIKLLSFPMLCLMDYDVHAKSLNCLKHFAINSKDARNTGNQQLLDELSSELSKLEKKLGDFDSLNDLTKIINDEMAYIARTKGLKAILDEHKDQKKYLESLKLLGSITFIENILYFAMYAQLFKTRNDIPHFFSKISKVYRLILNQLNREDIYYLDTIMDETNTKDANNKLSKCLEVIRTAHDANRLHFHDNLKSFIIYSLITKDPVIKKPTEPLYESLAQIFSRILTNLPKNFTNNPKKTALDLVLSNNLLTHFYQIIRDLLRFTNGQMFSAEFTVKLFEESVFSNFFRFLDFFLNFLASSPPMDWLKDPLFSRFFPEIIGLILTNLTKIIKVFLFIKNDLDVELSINNKLERNESLKPFLNFIEIEILNGFAICLKHFHIDETKAISGENAIKKTEFPGISKQMSSFFEICLVKLRSISHLKHVESSNKPAPFVKKAKKRPPLYGYGFEDNYDATEWNKLSEDAINEISNMGFSKEVAELAIASLEYPSIEAATEWILSHPEEVKKAEEEANKERNERKIQEEEIKKGQKATTSIKPSGTEKINLGKKQMNDFPEREYLEEINLILWSLGRHFLKNIVQLSNFEKFIWDFLLDIINKQKPELQSPLSLEIYGIIAESMKETISGFNQKVSLKLGLKKYKQGNEIKDKDMKEEKNEKIIVEKPEKLANLEDKLVFIQKIENLEQVFGLLLKASILKENAELRKKLLREKNCIELLRFLEKLLETIETTSKENSKEILFKMQDLTLKILIFCNEAFSQVKEQKPEFMKPLLVLMISFLSQTNNFYKHHQSNFLNKLGLEGFMALLIIALENNVVNIKYFIEKKGLQELLKLEGFLENEQIDGCLLGLLSKLLEILLIDNDLIESHMECQIKKFFYDRHISEDPSSKYKGHVVLNEFLEYFKEYHQNTNFSKLVKKLCIISKKLGKKSASSDKLVSDTKDSLKPPINEKVSQNIITLLENIHIKNENSLPLDKKPLVQQPEKLVKSSEPIFFIKLVANSNFTTLMTVTNEETQGKLPSPGFQDKKNKMDIEEISKEVKETKQNEIKSIDFTLKGPALSVLHNLLEMILVQFSNHLSKNKRNMLLNYPILMKLLHLMIRKYPLLIPSIVKFNCSKILRKLGSFTELLQLKLINSKKKESFSSNRSISFLKFFLRVLSFYSLEKFHHFLLELSLDNYLLYEPKVKEKAVVEALQIQSYSALIRQKVLNNIYSNLKQQVESPSFLQNADSFKSVFVYSSMHVFLLRIIEFSKLSLKLDDQLSHNFLKLYGDAFKSLTIQAFQNNEPAFLVLQTPLSLLYQLYLNSICSRKPEFKIKNLNSQMIQGKILHSDASFFDDWKQIYSSSDTSLQEILDINPLRLTGLRSNPPAGDGLHHNPALNMEAPQILEDDVEDNDDNINYEDLIRNPGLHQEAQEDDNIEVEENEGIAIEEHRDTGEVLLEEVESDSEEDIEDDEEEDDENENAMEEEEEEEEEEGSNEEEEINVPPINAGHIEEEEEEEDDEEESESNEDIEEEKANAPKELLRINTTTDSYKDLLPRNFSYNWIQSVLLFEGISLDEELHKSYMNLLRLSKGSMEENEGDSIYKELSIMNTVTYSPLITFYTEWQGMFQKIPQKNTETLFSPTRRETNARNIAGLEEDGDNIFLLERLMPGVNEEGLDDGSNNPLRLLNMLINEREDRYRNYFQDMRSHLDLLRGFLNPSLLPGDPAPVNNRERIERENLAEISRPQVNIQLNEELVGSFRNNMINDFQDRIENEEIEEEKKAENQELSIDINAVRSQTEEIRRQLEVVNQGFAGERQDIQRSLSQEAGRQDSGPSQQQMGNRPQALSGQIQNLIDQLQVLQEQVIQGQLQQPQQQEVRPQENVPVQPPIQEEQKVENNQEQHKQPANNQPPVQPEQQHIIIHQEQSNKIQEEPPKQPEINQPEQQNVLIHQEQSNRLQEEPKELQEEPKKPELLQQENPNKIQEEESKTIENANQSSINFEDLGLPANFLEINHIDPVYFNSLSEDLQMDIILQNLPKDKSEEPSNNNALNPPPQLPLANSNVPQPPSNNLLQTSVNNPVPEESKGQDMPPNPMELLDPEILAFINELPENLRKEVLDQQLAPFTQQNNAPPQQEIDNATFLASLLPELREEVLLTASPEFLETLPPEIIAEAQNLRDRVNFRNPSRYWQRGENYGALPKKKDKKPEKPINLYPAPIKDKSIIQKFNSIDEKVLENVLSFIYSDRSLFQKLPLGLLQTLMRSPIIEYKILDALLFVLLFENLPHLKDSQQDKFPYLCLYEKNGINSNYEKVYNEVSLRSLYLLAKFTFKASCNYFIENDEKKGLECLNFLRQKKSLFLTKNNKMSNLNEFLGLTGYAIFQKSFMHLDLLVLILFNITEKIRVFKANDVDLKIEPECIGNLCHILSIDFIDDNIMKKLSHIISVLCLEKKNLDCFIEQLKIIIFKISDKMNVNLEENLMILRENVKIDESLIMNQVEGHLEGEKKIYKIFKIIKELFEKALSLEKNEKKDIKDVKDVKDVKEIKDLDKEKEKNVKESMEEEKKEPINLKQSQEKSNEIKRKEVRDSFQTLIMNESLNNLWINVTELLMILNEKYPNSVNFLNPIIHKLISVLEGFFIIYSIMRDDYALNKQVDQMKKIPNISYFEDDSENIIILEKTISNLRNSKITIDEMFALLCEKNKKILNMMIRQNPNLLSESMNIVVAKMPKILEFDIKKTYFRRELKKLRGDQRDRYYHPISNI